MPALLDVRRRLADAARLHAASGLYLAAASFHVSRLAERVAGGLLAPGEALDAALAAEAAALSVPFLPALERTDARPSL